MITKTTYDRI
ncbi:Putative uncharacterized protein [Lactobacillus delbrueckii subsp. lactis]|nr:Putative uncharacterized protein [Lactobacillus delbrueckii subsp. lactis]CDR78276.1 Putative uncharacterized protein [Lactobacillus delbrueckii subsp. lactis]